MLLMKRGRHMQEQKTNPGTQQIDFSKPFVVYKNRGCYSGFLSVLCVFPFMFALCSLIFPPIALFPWWGSLAILLASAALWWFLRSILHPDAADEPVVIVSDEGIRWCRETAFVDPWFVPWEDFVEASVETTHPGMAHHVEIKVKNPDKPEKNLRRSIGLVDAGCSEAHLVEIIYGYYSRHRSPEPGEKTDA